MHRVRGLVMRGLRCTVGGGAPRKAARERTQGNGCYGRSKQTVLSSSAALFGILRASPEFVRLDLNALEHCFFSAAAAQVQTARGKVAALRAHVLCTSTRVFQPPTPHRDT